MAENHVITTIILKNREEKTYSTIFLFGYDFI